MGQGKERKEVIGPKEVENTFLTDKNSSGFLYLL